jgi:hypothetical protein
MLLHRRDPANACSGSTACAFSRSSGAALHSCVSGQHRQPRTCEGRSSPRRPGGQHRSGQARKLKAQARLRLGWGRAGAYSGADCAHVALKLLSQRTPRIPSAALQRVARMARASPPFAGTGLQCDCPEIGAVATIWHADLPGTVLRCRTCQDCRRQTHVRTFTGRIQRAVGP